MINGTIADDAWNDFTLSYDLMKVSSPAYEWAYQLTVPGPGHVVDHAAISGNKLMIISKPASWMA